MPDSAGTRQYGRDGATPEAVAQFLRSEMNRYTALVKKADVKVD
jgi:hypothetical protein